MKHLSTVAPLLLVLSSGLALAAPAKKLTADQISKALDDQRMSDASGFDSQAAELVKHLGPPSKTSTGKIQVFYYDAKHNPKPTCDMVTVVPTPYGHAGFSESMNNGDACNKVKRVKKQVDEARDGTEPLAWAATAKKFAALGKPDAETNSKLMSWRYTEDDACRYLTIYEAPETHAVEHISLLCDAPKD